MHVSKNSMWRRIWKILQNFLETKQGLAEVADALAQSCSRSARSSRTFCPSLEPASICSLLHCLISLHCKSLQLAAIYLDSEFRELRTFTVRISTSRIRTKHIPHEIDRLGPLLPKTFQISEDSSIFIFIWQTLSNYRITRFKRFISWFTGKLWGCLALLHKLHGGAAPQKIGVCGVSL